ncbi:MULTISPECIES: hypothetical protein [unclassified Kitasatospora]|uniref:hypothetical protein n=1 Tax=unclassified Kitasatospora TaxID=2633591 RepID=UPI00053ABDF0|nr:MULTISPECIES: hypothetical protein [unclassified Kitasatospora]
MVGEQAAQRARVVDRAGWQAEAVGQVCGGGDCDLGSRMYLDHDDRDVPDPMGRPAAEFAACALLIEAGAVLHLR